MPPVIARLSLSPSSSNGSPSARNSFGADGSGGGGGGESDVFDEVDDTEMQLQNTISHIERLILSSRKVKTLTPGAPAPAAGAAGAGAAREAHGFSESGGGEGDGASAGGAGARPGDGDGDAGATASGVGGSRVPRTRIPPKIDRAALLQRRQSTSFFDTKPVFSARDSSSTFTKMWNGGGGAEADERSFGALGGGNGDGVRRPLTARPAHARRQSEKWGWREGVGAEDVALETPPTVEGSTESRSESPSNG